MPIHACQPVMHGEFEWLTETLKENNWQTDQSIDRPTNWQRDRAAKDCSWLFTERCIYSSSRFVWFDSGCQVSLLNFCGRVFYFPANQRLNFSTGNDPNACPEVRSGLDKVWYLEIPRDTLCVCWQWATAEKRGCQSNADATELNDLPAKPLICQRPVSRLAQLDFEKVQLGKCRLPWESWNGFSMFQSFFWSFLLPTVSTMWLFAFYFRAKNWCAWWRLAGFLKLALGRVVFQFLLAVGSSTRARKS